MAISAEGVIGGWFSALQPLIAGDGPPPLPTLPFRIEGIAYPATCVALLQASFGGGEIPADQIVASCAKQSCVVPPDPPGRSPSAATAFTPRCCSRRAVSTHCGTGLWWTTIHPPTVGQNTPRRLTQFSRYNATDSPPQGDTPHAAASRPHTKAHDVRTQKQASGVHRTGEIAVAVRANKVRLSVSVSTL